MPTTSATEEVGDAPSEEIVESAPDAGLSDCLALDSTDDVDVSDPELVDRELERRRTLRVSCLLISESEAVSRARYRAWTLADAMLATRGFQLHRAQLGLARSAIAWWLDLHDLERVQELMREVREAEVVPVWMRDLTMSVAALGDDRSSLTERIVSDAPDLAPDQVDRIRAVLVRQATLEWPSWGDELARIEQASIVAERAPGVALSRRAAATITPAGGALWAIAALAGGQARTTAVFCSDTPLPRSIGRFRWLGRLAITDHCAGYVNTRASHIELGASTDAIALASGRARMFVEVDGALVGLGGEVRDGVLRVDSATESLVHADLVRAQADVVAPIAALRNEGYSTDSRAITLPLARRRRASVLSALGPLQLRCEPAEATVTCALGGPDQLAAAAFAAFLAGR